MAQQTLPVTQARTNSHFNQTMYNEYFGISEDPFAITPDPKFMFLSERHREALAHLIYGVTEGGGFVQLTGEVGTGKTTLCRNLLLLLPEELNIALIFNPRQTPLELMASLCDELHISYPDGCDSIKVLVDNLNRYLLENHTAGRRTVVILDEAQNLSFEALEQVRLLTNLETATQKLLQIILVGQPELHSLLSRPELRQLAQRITARYHLSPLTAEETKAYVSHRLNVVGYQRRLFTPAALRVLHHLTGGIPRLINVVCGRAMLAAYGRHKEVINRSMLNRVAKEVRGDIPRGAVPDRWAWGSVALLSLAVGLYSWSVLAPAPLGDLLDWHADNPAVTPAPQVVAQEPEPAPQIAELQPLTELAPGPTTEIPLVEEPASGPPVDPLPAVTTVPSDETTTVASLDASPVSPAPASQMLADQEAESPAAVPAPEPQTSNLAPEPLTPLTEPSASIPEPSASIPEPLVSLQGSAIQALDSPLSLMSMLDDVANAFTTLFGYWQAVYPVEEEGSACEKADAVGLKCIFGRGSWRNLEFYNRPAVIELLLDSGRRYHIVVAALEDDQVTLDLGKHRVTLPTAEVDHLWSGSYIVLWRPPKLNHEYLAQGSRGPDIAWLSDMLDRAEGREPAQHNSAKPQVFDWGVKSRVIQFQRSVGLAQDGIVGKQTLIKLNSAINDPDTPALRLERG
ncbi:MAG: AAA family ATPase [Pseudomonadota bacterium]